MRRSLFLLALVGCGDPEPASPDAPPASPDAAAVDVDAPLDAPAVFGDLAGMCGVLDDPELTGPSPLMVRASLTFARAFVDPVDRVLLTPGGRRIAETPNAGGSSALSEVFAFEQLARCEIASLLKTETEITYDTAGKITDILVEVDGHKIGVSVTRAVAFPFGSTYSLSDATTLLMRKLGDVQASSMNVSAADRWEKQILAYLAWDDATADTVAQAWSMIDASTKGDTILLVTVTHGEDVFIYSNN